jgi:hypothetical protein
MGGGECVRCGFACVERNNVVVCDVAEEVRRDDAADVMIAVDADGRREASRGTKTRTYDGLAMIDGFVVDMPCDN